MNLNTTAVGSLDDQDAVATAELVREGYITGDGHLTADGYAALETLSHY